MSEIVAKWIKKYEAKMDHVRLSLKLGRIIEEVKSEGRVATAQAEFLDRKVKAILDRLNVLPDYRIPYYVYGRLLDKSQRTMRFMVDRIREHKILRATFEGLGCRPEILNELDKVLIYNRAIS